MRLRLRVERNALPPTQAIWPVKEGKTTIAQLVQHVNEVFPLEVDTWGLEDYSVTVGGYECLHYHELSTVCRDEDEVVIRPLEYVDVRVRTLTGRDQITADGRHLVDGVPFGRPSLKAPIRPEIRIPPRKRRKLVTSDETEGEQLMITQSEEDEDDDEELDDEEFEVNDANDSTSSDDTSDSESDGTEDSDDSSNNSSSSSDDSDTTSENDSDDESWSGLPASNQTTPKAKTASTLPNGIALDDSPRSPTGTKRKRGSGTQYPGPNQEPESKEYATGAGIPHAGKLITKERNHRRRDSRKLKYLKAKEVLPPDADLSVMREWSHGNLKRKEYLGNGIEEDAEDMFDGTSAPASVMKERAKRRTTDLNDDAAARAASGERLDPISSIQATGSGRRTKSKKKAKVQTSTASEREKNLEEQREELLSKIAAGGIEMMDEGTRRKLRESVQPSDAAIEEDDEPPQEMSSRQAAEATDVLKDIVHTTDDNIQMDTPTELPASVRRAQLDIASSRRLLFGSLGVRVPKTQEERDLVQKKLAGRPKRNVNALDQEGITESGSTVTRKANGTEALTETDHVEEDPGLWQENINLTAVECCDDGITLSTPPFPFYQRWDPQYNKKSKKKKKRNSSNYSANARLHGVKHNPDYVETYDKYNINADGDALQYDDASAEEEYWEDGALLGDEEEAEVDQDDGFPEVPAEVEQLPPILFDEVQEGDFVAFIELACDETTDWQPKMVTRTAKIINIPSSAVANGEHAAQSCTIQLSQRDFKTKVFDDEGNRVYGKFDMPELDDDDDDDEGQRVVPWQDLGAVKLVLRPEAAAEE